MKTKLMGVTVLVSGMLAMAAVGVQPAIARDAGPLDYTMVSLPDFTNADVGDVTHEPGYRPGNPNSINASAQSAVDRVLDDVLAHDPSRDVVLPGDTVDGRWGGDRLNTGTFGPVDTEEHRQAAVVNASNLYYSTLMSWFDQRNLRLLPTLGDHEIGDNPWGNESEYNQFKRRNLNLFKEQWAKNLLGNRFPDHPAGADDKYAYATMLAPDVELISLDVFTRTDTMVENRISDGQMTWLKEKLDDANARQVKWIIVQGHDPILGPVRFRYSSHEMYKGGESSPLWQLLKAENVDVYLCGEVHDTTAIARPGNPVQISHGGALARAVAGFMVNHFTDSELTMTLHDYPTAKVSAANGYLWDVNRPEDANTAIWNYPAPSTVSGTMTIGPDGTVKSRSGILQEATVVPVSGTSFVTTSLDRSGRHVLVRMDSNRLERSQVGGAPLRFKFRVDGRTVHRKDMEAASERFYQLNLGFGLPRRVQVFKNGAKVTDLVVRAAAARRPAPAATSPR